MSKMLNSLRTLIGLAIAAYGALMLYGGLRLVHLGGSPYYVVAGTALLACGLLVLLRLQVGGWIYIATLIGTTIWAIWEAGLALWPLMPRLLVFYAVGCWFLVPWRLQGLNRGPLLVRPRLIAAILLLILVCGVTAAEVLHRTDGPPPPPEFARAAESPAAASGSVSLESGNWAAFGRTNRGTRYAPLEQIGPDNVARLKVAWTYHTGDQGPRLYSEDTPIAVDNIVYVCTPHHIVDAVDGDSGKRLWRYDPEEGHTGAMIMACRGVAYAHVASALPAASCADRILLYTGDLRLIALDARTGKPCAGFGVNGTVDLHPGMGEFRKGMVSSTSPPLIVDGLAVIGSQVVDNWETNEPSGVIRAYDVVDGHLAWAWDMARPHDHGLPAAGETYTHATPNAWPPLAADDQLGLVYIPLGNATPDFFAGGRIPATEQYSDSLVALDVRSGELRWHFQTTRHDMWDYDLPSQPVLVDFPIGEGKTRPAVIQSTKRGEFFVLDRATGEPLTPVVDKPAPQGAVPGDFTSPTQPYSVGMPELNDTPLTERQMWGISPLDQLACRIRFREVRYDGQFTPQSTQGSINYPGQAGFQDWGGVSIDEARHLMLVTSLRMPFIMTLVPRARADALMSAEAKARQAGRPTSDLYGVWPNFGAPFAVHNEEMMSPAYVPCLEPPWGYISAINLDERKTVWRHPLGTGRDNGPYHWKVGLPLTLGVFNQGGTLTTKSGLTFVNGTIDYYARAFDSRTGEKLWESRLPAGAQSGPMSYVSSRTGRQYVIVTAGGHAGLGTRPGDSVIAYALKN